MKKFNTVLSISLFVICLALVAAPVLTSAALTRQLQLGSQGTDVSELQRFLAMDTSVYPSGLVTGYFGTLTRAAVTRFQAKNGISQVGRVGPQTMAAINAQMVGGVSGMIAPSFTAPVTVGLNGNVATFNVNTDIPSKVQVFYSPTPIIASENVYVTPMTVSLSGTAVTSGTGLMTSHSIGSLALEANRTYYFRAVAVAANGHMSVTQQGTFQSNY